MPKRRFTEEQIAWMREQRRLGHAYEQIADDFPVRFPGEKRPSPTTVMKYCKDVQVLVEEPIEEEESEKDTGEQPPEPISEKAQEKETAIIILLGAGKSKMDIIKEGKYISREVTNASKFYEKEFLPEKLSRLHDALEEYKVWNPEHAADLGEDPYETGVRDMHEKVEDAWEERDEAERLLKVDIWLRKGIEAKLEETTGKLEETQKAFENYKLEATKKVDRAEKAQKEAEKEARHWTCPKCGTFYFKVKTVTE